jgi:hypothetical protein
MTDQSVGSSVLNVSGGSISGPLMQLLMAPDIDPGADPSYELCKTIYSYHPLGLKMAESPISMAQSQPRVVTVQGAPDEVVKAFKDEWAAIGADASIHDCMRLSRIYGIASLVAGSDDVKPSDPFDMSRLWKQKVFFNALDPLNTAGALVLNQVPTAKDFNRPATVYTNGERFHPSRYVVVMNEAPIYLQYTGSAFGFVGRSVYQRALYPLKSFVRSMIADDMIATKLALLVAKQKSPGSMITRAMAAMAAVKRNFLQQAQSGQVLSIDTEETIETLNMQNVDGAGTFSRNNILKNIATAADMPAKLLENETMVAGFGEGTEDAKNIARYVNRIREKMNPLYAWFDNFVQYRAWNEEFYERLQSKYPQYKRTSFQDAFGEWRSNFHSEWPSFLIEPESEQTKVEQTRAETLIAVLQTLLPELDPANKARLIASALDNLSENKRLFTTDLSDLDYEELAAYVKQNADQSAGPGGVEDVGPAAKKLGRFG